MSNQTISVREIRESDLDHLCDYWFLSDDAYLESLGVDLKKMPARNEFHELIAGQIRLPFEEKTAYCIIWLLDDVPAGHSNINNIVFGKSAQMHLHIWQRDNRRKGLGSKFLEKTIPYYFDKFNLEVLVCEPFARNDAPEKTLRNSGFRFVREYITTPGSITFEQPVRRWQMTSADFRKKYRKHNDDNILS